MKKLYAIIFLLAITQLSCSSDPEQNRIAKNQLPKGNYTLIETTINGSESAFNPTNYEASENEFLNAANFPDGYGFNLSKTDTITFSKEMGQYLFEGANFIYDVDGEELQFKNQEINTSIPYKLEENRLTLFPDKGDLEKLTFAFSPFKPGKYDAIGYSIQKSANHRIAHQFLDVTDKRPLFDFRKDSTVHIASAFGIKVFKDSVFDYTVADKTITFKNGKMSRSIKYRLGSSLRLYLNDTIFKRIDLIKRKLNNGAEKR